MLFIPAHHPCNQDQQNHPRNPHALHAFRLHLRPLIVQIILFSILHLDTPSSASAPYVWIAAAIFVRAVANMNER